jgi:tyrosine-protein kinase
MNENTEDAISIFAPIWRRKWLILLVAVVVGVASYFYFKGQRPTFQASTQVYLGAASEEQPVGEKTGAKARGSAATEQAAVINLIIIERVRRRLREEGRTDVAKGSKVRAKSQEKSEFITVTAEAHRGRDAALLANLTAQAYVKRQNQIHERGIEKALAIARRQLRRIELTSQPQEAKKPATGAAGAKTGSGGEAAEANSGKATGSKPQSTTAVLQAANLSSKINQLESSLGTTVAQQVKPASADNAQMLSPKPRKDAIFGFVVGFVLACIAAYVLSRFDRRLRTLEEVEGVLALPILAAIPKVGRPVVRNEGRPRPSVQLLEPVRRLHTALELSDGNGRGLPRHGRGRVLAFVSADPGDGKSTLIADLALVQRDAGQRTVVVEANFRRPVQARLLGLEGVAGLEGALSRRVSPAEAMQRVLPLQSAVAEHPSEGAANVATALREGSGSLFVLAGGGAVANPPALLAGETASELLGSLANEFGYVLVDAPSPLEFSDVMPLLGLVDGIVVVARIGHTQEASARRLRQLLAGPSIAPVIGAVANFAGRSELKKYGFASPNGRAWPARSAGR